MQTDPSSRDRPPNEGTDKCATGRTETRGKGLCRCGPGEHVCQSDHPYPHAHEPLDASSIGYNHHGGSQTASKLPESLVSSLSSLVEDDSSMERRYTPCTEHRHRLFVPLPVRSLRIT